MKTSVIVLLCYINIISIRDPQLAVFLSLVRQQAPFFKVRSVLSLYASIDISKLARLTDISEEELVC
jgi:hypothetical protein